MILIQLQEGAFLIELLALFELELLEPLIQKFEEHENSIRVY